MRIFVTASIRQAGEVELKTLEEGVLCDNVDCPRCVTYDTIAGMEVCRGDVVVRNGMEFCSEACYLTTLDAKARMELTIPAADIPHRAVEDDRRFTNMPPPRDRTS